jgi:two-component system response regulator RegX3
VILDLNLPGLSGFEFLKRSKPSCPIVMFSSSGNPEDEKQALALGARQFVRKPLSYQDYADAVCNIVQRWTALDGAALTGGLIGHKLLVQAGRIRFPLYFRLSLNLD